MPNPGCNLELPVGVNFCESLQGDSFDGSSVCRVSVLNKQNFILIESSPSTGFICMLQISVCLLAILGKCKKKKNQVDGNFLQGTPVLNKKRSTQETALAIRTF